MRSYSAELPPHYSRLPSGLIVEKDQFRERVHYKGHWKFELFGPDGKLKDVREKVNLITTVGFQQIADALFNVASRPACAQYIGVGTGVTAANIADTTLQTESLRKTCSYGYASKVSTLASTFNAGEATGALTEAGVLSASSAGLLLNHVIYSVINKGALDVMTVTFTFTES